jgi:hypothetical protein
MHNMYLKICVNVYNVRVFKWVKHLYLVRRVWSQLNLKGNKWNIDF